VPLDQMGCQDHWGDHWGDSPLGKCGTEVGSFAIVAQNRKPCCSAIASSVSAARSGSWSYFSFVPATLHDDVLPVHVAKVSSRLARKRRDQTTGSSHVFPSFIVEDREQVKRPSIVGRES